MYFWYLTLLAWLCSEYFDLLLPLLQVGGTFFDTVVGLLNHRGRVSLCGAISLYNIEGAPPKGKAIVLSIVITSKRLVQVPADGLIDRLWKLKTNSSVDLLMIKL